MDKKRRTVAEVEAKQAGPAGCCEDYANYVGCQCLEEARRRERAGGGRRTVAEVMEARRHAVVGGCCDLFAEQRGCSCLAEARAFEQERAATVAEAARAACVHVWFKE